MDEYNHPTTGIRATACGPDVGCDPEELPLTRNTSEALETVHSGSAWPRGDEVITTTQDYPRMIGCWRQRARRDVVVLNPLRFPVRPVSMDDLLQRFEAEITPRTGVIHFWHVTCTTGQILPVKRICRMARERGIETIVDGAHSFAHFPFARDDLDCDHFGTSLYTGLPAPVGTGFLYVRRERDRERLAAVHGTLQEVDVFADAIIEVVRRGS